MIELKHWLYVLLLREFKNKNSGGSLVLIESSLIRNVFFNEYNIPSSDVRITQRSPLTDDVSETLIGMKTIRKPFLDLAIACEEVRWDDMITGENLLNVSHIYRSRCMGN